MSTFQLLRLLLGPTANALAAALAAALASIVLLLPLYAGQGQPCSSLERLLERLPGIERVGPSCGPG